MIPECTNFSESTIKTLDSALETALASGLAIEQLTKQHFSIGEFKSELEHRLYLASGKRLILHRQQWLPDVRRIPSQLASQTRRHNLEYLASTSVSAVEPHC